MKAISQLWVTLLIAVPTCVYLWIVQAQVSGLFRIAGLAVAVIYTFSTIVSLIVWSVAISNKT